MSRPTSVPRDEAAVPVEDRRAAAGPRLASRGIDVLLGLLIPAALVAGIYLAPFVRDPGELPKGRDTFGYLWRTDLVYEQGVEALDPDRSGLEGALGDRPAHPIVTSILRGVTGTSSLTVMWILPGALGAAIAVVAAGLAADGVREGRRLSGLAGVGVGGSSFVALTAIGYSTNVMFDVVALGVASIAIRVAFRPGLRGVVGGGLLLALGSLFHWPFTLVFAGVLLAFWALLAIRSVAWTAAPQPPEGAARRVAAVVGVAAALSLAVFLIAPVRPGGTPGYPDAGVERKSDLRLPQMALPVTLPAAGLGLAVIAFRRGSPQRRWSTALLGPWAALALVGLVGWYGIGLPTPPHRFAAFALGVPILIVLGAFGVRRWCGGNAGRVVAFVIGIAATIALAVSGARAWSAIEPIHEAAPFAQLATVRSYAAGLPNDTTLVLPIGLEGRREPVALVRAGLAPDLYRRIVFERVRLADGLPDPAEPAAVLFVDALIAQRAPAGGVTLGPGVSLLSGPAPGPIEIGRAPIAPSALGLAALTLVALGVMMIAGAGWAAALTTFPFLGVLSISPAFGLGFLALGGLVAGRVGVPVGGVGGVAVFAMTALVGAAAGLVVRLRGRGDGAERGDSPSSPSAMR
jgi:hypothetical protein